MNMIRGHIWMDLLYNQTIFYRTALICFLFCSQTIYDFYCFIQETLCLDLLFPLQVYHCRFYVLLMSCLVPLVCRYLYFSMHWFPSLFYNFFCFVINFIDTCSFFPLLRMFQFILIQYIIVSVHSNC